MSSPMLHDQKSFNRAAKVFIWNKWLLSAIGLWPLAPNDSLFNINFSYYFFHIFLEYVDLLLFINNLEHVTDNLTENMAFTQILMRMVMLKKYNRQLRAVINEALKDYDVTIYRNVDESEAFINYMKKAKLFVKLVAIFVAAAASSYFMKPIMRSSSVDESDGIRMNSSKSFILPYHFHIFYEVNDAQTYILTYISQVPLIFIGGISQIAADCLMVTLVFHVSGKLAVLAIRISQIKSDDAKICKMELNNIIIEHNRLLEMGKGTVEAFSVTVLAYLMSATLIGCIFGCQLLSTYSEEQGADIPGFCIFIVTVFFVSFVLCFISESLISENDKVYQAYYNCKWYTMPENIAKSLIVCMARSQQPLGLTVGDFGILYFSTLTAMAKTSMAYLSVLRSFLTE